MTLVRRLLAHRRIAALLLAAAVLLKLLVPTGHMLSVVDGRIAIVACTGMMPPQPAALMAHGHGGHAATDAPDADESGGGSVGGAEQPCAFAGLSGPALGGADPALLLAAIAFVLVAGLLPAVPPPPSAPSHLRPPLRGPPHRLRRVP